MTSNEILDIVALVQNNPLTKLSNDYGSKIIQKIQERFSSGDQQLFVANFYCYLNYNSKTDFVINLDRIWKWLGYGRIGDCKRVLIKNFTENQDYLIENYSSEVSEEKTEPVGEAEKQETRGRKPEYITLTVNCFKKLCLKSRTEKADQIHDYYIQLEEILNEVVAEQAVELQLKLQLKDKESEQTLVLNFRNKQVVYLITVEENIIKFGFTKNIEERLKQHRTEFGKHITLKYIFETIYNREFEIMIKQDSIISKHIIEKTYKNNQTELIRLDQIFSNEELNKRLEYLKNTVNGNLIINLIKENTELKLKLSEYELIIKNYKQIYRTYTTTKTSKT